LWDKPTVVNETSCLALCSWIHADTSADLDFVHWLALTAHPNWCTYMWLHVLPMTVKASWVQSWLHAEVGFAIIATH